MNKSWGYLEEGGFHTFGTQRKYKPNPDLRVRKKKHLMKEIKKHQDGVSMVTLVETTGIAATVIKGLLEELQKENLIIFKKIKNKWRIWLT